MLTKKFYILILVVLMLVLATIIHFKFTPILPSIVTNLVPEKGINSDNNLENEFKDLVKTQKAPVEKQTIIEKISSTITTGVSTRLSTLPRIQSTPTAIHRSQNEKPDWSYSVKLGATEDKDLEYEPNQNSEIEHSLAEKLSRELFIKPERQSKQARTVKSSIRPKLTQTENTTLKFTTTSIKDEPSEIAKTKAAMPPGIKLISNPRIVINSGLTLKQAEDLYYQYVARNDIECAHQQRLGHSADGGWNMCLEGPYAPSKPCIVYSFGINNDWSFDDAVSTQYGCEVRAFDPSMFVADHKHSSLVYFYQKGLSDNNSKQPNGWKMETLATFMKDFNHQDKIIDYLKIDIEYNEWHSLEKIFEEGALKNVKQFGFETHTHEVLQKQSTLQDFIRYWTVLDKLEQLGFRRWYNHFNHFGKYTSRSTGKGRTCCYEMVYINMNFLSIELPTPGPMPTIATTEKQTKKPGDMKLPSQIKMLPLSTVTVTQDMTAQDAEMNFYSYVTYNDLKCDQNERLGNYGDGGWDMCTVGPYAPQQPCIVYSFGINNDWTFDDAISKKYKCQVRAFDPSMRVGDHPHSKLVYFYHTGIGGKNTIDRNGWKIRTLKTLFKEIGDAEKTIDMLKIDIEYNEWESFKTMFKENALKNVKQFVFEIHTHELSGGSPTTVDQFVQYFHTLKTLEELGFRKWKNHFNHYGVYNSVRTHMRRTCCYELFYINTNFLR